MTVTNRKKIMEDLIEYICPSSEDQWRRNRSIKRLIEQNPGSRSIIRKLLADSEKQFYHKTKDDISSWIEERPDSSASSIKIPSLNLSSFIKRNPTPPATDRPRSIGRKVWKGSQTYRKRIK